MLSGRASTITTDREGVALVARIVSRDLRWIFREQAVVDQGIDGQVEVAVEGQGTGRLIAVQIKSGHSYFRKVKGGWAFYYSERERALWLNHVLPVMVILVDLEADTAFWQGITPSAERRTKKGYAVTIPRDQKLSTAGEAWELAASGMEQRAAERYAANLEVLPPPVRRLIETEGAGGAQGALIALHLAEGRFNPAGTAQALMTARPSWMQTRNAWSWRALGTYCAHHAAMRESADALEIAAESSGEASAQRLAAAALHVSGQDRTRAADLVRAARERGGADVLVAVVEAILDHRDGDASPLRSDAVLAACGAEISTNVLAQMFLAENALRLRDLASAAIHAERALALDPDGTEAMALVARICARRSSTADAQTDDTARAVTLLSAAVEQRRHWAGPTLELLAALARVLTLRGEHGAALRWLLPPPHGTASPGEAEDPRLLRYALTAAHMHGSADLADSVIAQMAGSIQDRVVQVRLGLLELTEPEMQALWSEELARAESDRDWEAVAQAVHRLATMGIDVVDRLQPLERDGILPPGTQRLPRALVVLRRRPEDGLALLRSLAAEDVGAAESLIGALMDRNLLNDAVEACAAAYERFRSPGLLTQRAMLLFRANPDDRAEKALLEALQVEVAPAEKLMLATCLAQLADAADRWSEAESILSAALAYMVHPPDSTVWNLVEVQLAGAAGVRAAATITRHRPQCRSVVDARRWAAAMANVPWDDAIASEAIALASRFSDHPALATGLLTHLVTTTRGTTEADSADDDAASEGKGDQATGPADDRPVVPGELHRRAFEVLDELIQTHGAATGAQVIKSSSTEELMEKITELARLSAPPDLSDLLDKIARGQLPLGLLAPIVGRTYTAALVRRAAGQLVAVAADDDEHQREVDAALAARGGPVVVDLSTLLVLSRLSDADAVAGQVSTMLVPRSARDDVLRAAVEVQGLGASPGSLGWDARFELPVFRAQSAEEYRLVRERTELMERAVRRASVKDVRASDLFEGIRNVAPLGCWLAAIELAAQEGVPLWCDDLAVRRLASSVGVAAFSTMAIAEVLRDARLKYAAGPDEVDEVIQFAGRVTSELLAEYVVDVPVTFDQLAAQARADGWNPGAAAVAISRPAWWAWQDDPISQLLSLYSAVAESASHLLPGWQYAAMLGGARSQATPEATSQMLARLALLGWEQDMTREPHFEDLVEGCRNARRAADTLDDVGDPVLALPAARSVLREAGVLRSEEVVSALIAKLGASAPDD